MCRESHIDFLGFFVAIGPIPGVSNGSSLPGGRSLAPPWCQSLKQLVQEVVLESAADLHHRLSVKHTSQARSPGQVSPVSNEKTAPKLELRFERGWRYHSALQWT